MAIEGRVPSAVDRRVGERVRMRRLLVNMSQVEMGEKIGVTFQQVQKYEKGTNRIGSSRLHRIAQILGVPISFFFEDIGGQKSSPAGLPEYFVNFMGTSQGQRLVEGLTRIKDKRVLGDLLTLVETISEPATKPAAKARGRRSKRSAN
jgi:transcriptional regulator with XRE-family HTH domain